MEIPAGFEKATPYFAHEKIKTFKAQNKDTEEGLKLLIAAFPDNEDPAHVLLKVAAINSLYSTQIYAVHAVAELIVNCHIDRYLEVGSADAVEKIMTVHVGPEGSDGKARTNYSFATKYCAWHKKDKYPLYDSKVDKCLRAYQQLEQFTENKFTQNDLGNYDTFRKIVDAFRKKYLDGLSYKETDMFLYQLGAECFPS